MVRMGMIGCGKMADAHQKGLVSLKNRMQFTGFADVVKERAEKAAETAGGAVAATDYRDILDHVDAIILALPHHLHHSVGLTCLKAGKHLLMEKPLALKEEECEELVAADTSPDPVLMVGYVMRHDPLWTKMGELIREKTYGEVFHVSIWTEQYTDLSRGAWIGKADQVGGGQLFSHGCHYIDLLLHWLGEPVHGTHVGTNLCTPWMEREGTSNVSLKFKSGATGYHFGTWGARGSRLRYSVHAHCADGMLELNHVDRTITLHRDKSGGDLPALESELAKGERLEDPKQAVIYRGEPHAKKAVVEQTESFLDCIENKKKPEISAAASLPGLRLIWKLYEAEEKGIVADLSSIGRDSRSG